TALKDRHTKFEIYQQQRIPYYIIIDTDKKQVEIWQMNEVGKFDPVSIDEKQPQLFTFNDCSFSILFENIWS
ncbi:MAG: Uma2 family endonuclease, partial [Chitinophagaceae bacterium]